MTDFSRMLMAFDKAIDVEATRHAIDGIAFDRSTVRRVDPDGRLHVETSNISKANVCPYLGREIPDSQSLNLDPDKIYQLYRDPEELARGAATFNNLPLLSKHVPVSAADHRPELVVGSTGSHATFDAPHLKNSLVIWAKDAIQAVEESIQKELSSAYRYRADMTPGVAPDGVKFDGVMRDIVGNHVALVKEGRAGADVVVGDSTEELAMKNLSRKAAMAQGALAVYLLPKLAQDQKISVLPLLKDVTQKNFKAKKAGIATGLKKAAEGKLAQDASLDDVVDLLDTLEKMELPDDEPKTEDEAEAVDPMVWLKSKLSSDDFAEYEKMAKPAKDAERVTAMTKEKTDAGEENTTIPLKDPDKDPAKKDAAITPAAMDAAIQKAAKAATESAIKIQQQIRSAEREVHPYVGNLTVAFDSAEEVYRAALDILKIDNADIHASALPTILKMQPVPGEKKPTHRVAMDGKSVKGFNERFPGAASIGNL